jgi:PAS domain-containing protein
MIDLANNPAAEELKQTLDALPDLVCIVGLDHKIRWMNAVMKKRFGIKPSEAVDLTCYETVYGVLCPPEN